MHEVGVVRIGHAVFVRASNLEDYLAKHGSIDITWPLSEKRRKEAHHAGADSLDRRLGTRAGMEEPGATDAPALFLEQLPGGLQAIRRAPSYRGTLWLGGVVTSRPVPECVISVIVWAKKRGDGWSGTTGELFSEVGVDEVSLSAFGKYLAANSDYMAECGVLCKRRRTRKGTVLTLSCVRTDTAADGMEHDRLLAVRMSQTDYEALSLAAEASGLTVSDFVRSRCL